MKSEIKEQAEKEKKTEFKEGVDYYFENGLMVLTERFLLKRGYCCGGGCRHCPYPKGEKLKKPSCQLEDL